MRPDRRLLLTRGIPTMDIMSRLREKARSNPRTVVFPEGNEPTIVAAARRILDEGYARPILLGSADAVALAARSAGVSLDGIELRNAEGALLAEYVAAYAEETGFPEAVTESFLVQPLFFAAMMVRRGAADAMVAGLAHATEDVIMASEMLIGTAEGVDTPSSFFLMDIPAWEGSEGPLLMFADCAVNPNPDAEQLADIALSTAHSAATMFGWTPRVAMLSFSSKGSADHADVDKVKAALSIAQQREPGLAIDGEFQADTAIVESVASKKLADVGEVAGRANVLVFPDLDAGNIAYKLVQRLTGGAAYGPVLQGFAKPVSDLSRGATVDDVVGATIMAVAGVE